LQKQLDMVKAEVVKARKELRFLKTYKDMEFPVKALQIADMKKKLDKLKEMQQVKKWVTLYFTVLFPLYFCNCNNWVITRYSF